MEWEDRDRATKRRASAYDETYKRAKMGCHHWPRATAWYEDYVSVKYRPALVLPARPGFAVCDGGVAVLPGRLGAAKLADVAGSAGTREEQIARLEDEYPRLPWLQCRFTRPGDVAVAQLVELANRLVDGINHQRQRCAAVLGQTAPQIPPLTMYVVPKCTRIGVPHLYSGEFVHSTGTLKTPPSDTLLAQHADPAVREKWARKAWGTAQHHGRLELLLLEGDDPALLRAHRATFATDDPREPVVGDFPVERRFFFPYRGFRDFATTAWEKVQGAHSNHPTRIYKDVADWVREGAGTAAAYPTERRAIEAAWAAWEWRKHGAVGDRASDRWRYPQQRILDSLPQLTHCIERLVEQNAVFVRDHELRRYASCAAELGLLHHSRTLLACCEETPSGQAC
jgi:hypothetical protein